MLKQVSALAFVRDFNHSPTPIVVVDFFSRPDMRTNFAKSRSGDCVDNPVLIDSDRNQMNLMPCHANAMISQLIATIDGRHANRVP